MKQQLRSSYSDFILGTGPSSPPPPLFFFFFFFFFFPSTKRQVRVVASLPCYGPANLEQQRGAGVFERSIAALRLLNSLG